MTTTTVKSSQADFEMLGGWGNRIDWTGTEQFKEQQLTSDSRFKVHGWKSPIPKIGQTLKAEFVKSWMVFEFVEVKQMRNPQDMFFAVVKPIAQHLKK